MAASVLTAPMASIGVPREIKADEQRVALTPDAVRELVSHGLEVRIESGAGDGATVVLEGPLPVPLEHEGDVVGVFAGEAVAARL